MFRATARRAYYLTMGTPARTAPYTSAVVSAMRKLYVGPAEYEWKSLGMVVDEWDQLPRIAGRQEL